MIPAVHPRLVIVATAIGCGLLIIEIRAVSRYLKPT